MQQRCYYVSFIKIIILHSICQDFQFCGSINCHLFQGVFPYALLKFPLKRSWIKWTTTRPLTIIPWTRLTGTTMEFLLESKHNMNRNERNRIQVAKVFRDTCQVSRKFWAVWETSDGCENSETKLRI